MKGYLRKNCELSRTECGWCAGMEPLSSWFDSGPRHGSRSLSLTGLCFDTYSKDLPPKPRVQAILKKMNLVN